MAELSQTELVDLGLDDLSAENIEEHLPQIISTISEGRFNPNFLQLLCGVFGHLVPQIDIEDLEHKLLVHVLPTTTTTFEHSLSEIKTLLDDSEEMDEEIAINISKMLQTCLDILTGYGELLTVLSQRTVESEHVRSLNRHLPQILIEAFSHCKDSEICYGSYFEESTTILTTFFRKAYEIQSKYYKILDEGMIFTASDEDEWDCLVIVMDKILKLAKIVVSLDVKTSVDQWKVYAKLYSKHVTSLKNLIDISQPLCLLASSIQQIILSLRNFEDAPPDKLQAKLLKIGNFLLKLSIKLCELSDCNFREGWPELLELLLSLHSCTKTYDLSEQLNEEMRRHISVGAAPLLSVLLKEERFHGAFNNLKDSCEELNTKSKVGLTFLSLSIMKNIVDGKAPAYWRSWSLIELVIELYDSCGLTIDMNSNFEGSDAYTKMMSVCAAFMIATIDADNFSELENYLVSKLFDGNLHASIFVSDFICLLGRLTSDSYCTHLIIYLCEALKNWPDLSFNLLEYKTVGTLVHRLWGLLSPKSREPLLSKYNSPDSTHVLYWLDGSGWNAEQYENFCLNPSPASFVSLMANPPNKQLRANFQCDTSRLVAQLVRSLSYLKNQPSSPEWCHQLLMYSFKIFSFLGPSISQESFIEVFETLEETSPELQMTVNLFMANCTESLTDMRPSPQLVRVLASVLIPLLSTDDSVLKSSTLQILEAFNRSPLFKEVVLLVSSHDENCLNAVNEVLGPSQNIICPSNTSLCGILNSLPKLEHKCVIQLEPPTKKLKIDCSHRPHPQETAYLHQLKSDVVSLKNAHKQFGLSDEAKLQINSAVEDLLSLIGKDDTF